METLADVLTSTTGISLESSDFSATYAAERAGLFSSEGSSTLFETLADRLHSKKAHTWGEANHSGGTAVHEDESFSAGEEEYEDMFNTYPPARRSAPESGPTGLPVSPDSGMSSPFSATSAKTMSTCTPDIYSPNASELSSIQSLSSSPYSPPGSAFAAIVHTSPNQANETDSNLPHKPAPLEHSHSHLVERVTLPHIPHITHAHSAPLHASIEHAFAMALPHGTTSTTSSLAALSTPPASTTASALPSSDHSLLNQHRYAGISPLEPISTLASVVSGTASIPIAPTPSVLVVHGSLAHPSSSASVMAGSPPKRTHASTTVVPLAAPPRPASVGPSKLPHRRRKSGKRVPPPPFSSELLKAARLRLDRLPDGGRSQQQLLQELQMRPETLGNGHSSSSATSPGTNGTTNSGTAALPFSTKQYYHSRGSSSNGSGSSGGGSGLSGGSHSSSYDSLCSLGNSSPRHDYTLPPEVWERVFRFLTPGDLMDLHSVSSTWSSASWEGVREVDLTGRHEMGFDASTWLKHLPSMTRLTKVTISARLPTGAAVASIAQITSIESLTIRCHPTETSLSDLMPLTQLPSLKQLALKLPSQIGPSVLHGLLQHLPNLQHFKVETLRESFADVAFSDIGCMTSLKTLDLSWCKSLSRITFARIAKLSTLETLILDMCGCDVALTGLSQLRVLPNLSSLSLRWCDQLTDAILPTLAEFRSLRTLDVSYCQYITASAIASNLPNAQVTRSTRPLSKV